jgi:apolipoprotein N-acyltransferase
VAVDDGAGKVGLAICFDSCYPEVIRDLARLPGVNVIALPAVDPFASNHFISAMHAAYSPFRCAEEGVAMVRADGRGYSQIVAPFGTIVAELPPGDGVLGGEVSTATYWTPYKQFGDWFLFVCVVLVVGGWYRARKTGRSISNDSRLMSDATGAAPRPTVP